MPPHTLCHRLLWNVLLILTTVAPAIAGEPSPRRKAEIEALVARRQAERQRRARIRQFAEAEMDRQASEIRAHETAMAQAVNIQQMAVNNSLLAKVQLARTQLEDDRLQAEIRDNTIFAPIPVFRPLGYGCSSWQPITAPCPSRLPACQADWAPASTPPLTQNQWPAQTRVRQAFLHRPTFLPISAAPALSVSPWTRPRS